MIDSTGNGKGSADRVRCPRSYAQGWDRVFGRRAKRTREMGCKRVERSRSR